MNRVAYVDQLCDRCGSKRKIGKKWKETMVSFTGKKTVVEFTQIVCTNNTCQIEFDEDLAREAKKRMDLQKQKEKNQKERKEASISMTKKAKSLNKNRSRI